MDFATLKSDIDGSTVDVVQFDWRLVRGQWLIMSLGCALAFLQTLALQALFLPALIAAPLALVFVIGAYQFLRAAIKNPLPTEYPTAVRFADWVEDTWWKQTTPAQFGEFRGERVLERWDPYQMEVRDIFDLDGRMIGYEQEIDWSYNDMEWVNERESGPREVETIFTAKTDERLPFIARRRSPKLNVIRHIA